MIKIQISLHFSSWLKPGASLAEALYASQKFLLIVLKPSWEHIPSHFYLQSLLILVSTGLLLVIFDTIHRAFITVSYEFANQTFGYHFQNPEKLSF